MKQKVATAMMDMTVGQRAELQCGKVPAAHMAAIMKNGKQLKSGDRPRPTKAKAKATTTTAAKAKVPTMTHAAAVKQARIDSIRQAREDEAQAKRNKELEDARNLGPRIIEDEKRRAAFKPIADAMDRAAIKPEPKAKATPKAKPEPERDRRGRAAFKTHAAMKAGKERTAYYKKNRLDILHGAGLENK